MKKFVFITGMLFGICFLAIQCRNNDDTDEFVGGNSDQSYIVDSFSIKLCDSNSQEVWFDSTVVEPKHEIKDIIFHVDFKELRYVFQSNKPVGFGFEAMAVPAPRSILQMDGIEITSNKNIETTDSTITAGTDLSSLFVFSWEYPNVFWSGEADFLLREYESAYNRPLAQGFYAVIPIEIKESLDQHFSMTIVTPSGKRVSALSPRVLAK